MSNCIKDLFDYDLVKKCCRCTNILLKSNFNKKIKSMDGLQPYCRSCTREYYLENRDKIKNYYLENRDKLIKYQKLYDKQNRDKISTRMNEYFKNRKQLDLNFKLVCNLRSRTNQAFKSQNVRKTNKTFDLLGCSHSFFKNWIIHQLYGDMTEENYGKVWCLDHCYPLAKCNLDDKNDLCRYTDWINLRPLYIKENIIKGDKIDMRLYLLQEIKSKYFLKLNNDQEGFNEDLY